MAVKTNKLISPTNKEIEIDSLAKVDNGEVKDIEGNPLKVDEANKLGGKTKDDIYQDVNNIVSSYSYKSKFSFKKLLNTQRSFPERWMLGVNEDNQLLVWGYRNTYVENTGSSDSLSAGVLPVPKAVAGIEPKEIVATTWSIFVLYPNGDLYVKGYNSYGQLGVGNTSHQYSFVKVMENVEKVVSSSHGYHQDQNSVFVIKNNNGKKELYGCGMNGYGQLGRGHTTSPMTTFGKAQFTSELDSDENIIDVVVVSTNVVSVYALTDKGKLFACGYNGYGQLGLGDTTNRNIFTRVLGILDGKRVLKVVASGGTRSGSGAYYYYSAIVLAEDSEGNKRVYSCGYNGYGQLGLGNTTNYSTFQEITFLSDKNIVDIYGYRGSWTSYFAKAENGDIYAWGYNGYGQLGIGNTNNALSPVKVNIPEPVKEVYLGAGGGTYSYFMTVLFETVNGNLYATGYDGENQVGTLGGSTSTPVLIEFPVNIANIGIKQISTGGYSSSWTWYVLLNNGDVYAWGDNDYQQARSHDSTGNIAYPSLIGV